MRWSLKNRFKCWIEAEIRIVLGPFQVDNEHLNRKKSKCCCIYVKPKVFGESDTESDSDEVSNWTLY